MVRQAGQQKRGISTPVIDAQDEYYALIATWMLRMLLGSAAAFRGKSYQTRTKWNVCDSDCLSTSIIIEPSIVSPRVTLTVSISTFRLIRWSSA